MTTKTKHSAAGQMAGYLFQPERALYRLALSPRGALVGIETLDDVAVVLPDGQQIREQDKHYTSGKKPLADRSKEFWNSLHIWLKAVQAEDLDTTSVDFHLVTNQTLKVGLAFDLMHLEKTNEAAIGFVARLREIGDHPPEDLKALFSQVLDHSDEELVKVICKMSVFDATCAVHGSQLRTLLHDHLHLPPVHADEIIQGLLGWVDELVLERIRQRNPVWISREAFSEQYRRLLHRYQDIAFIRETEEAFIPVAEDERASRKNRLFVKQLQWIGCTESDEDNQILDAIDAHIRSGSEVARLSQVGVVTLADFRAFDERLVSFWKNLRRLYIPRPIPHSEDEQQTIGRQLLNQALSHREILAGQQTSEFYLTQGAFHHLADDADGPPRVGWHPLYSEQVKTLQVPKEEAHALSHRS